MNITIVSEVLGKENNGTTVAAMNLINYLKKQGHNVKVVCPDEDKKGEPGYYVLSHLNWGKLADKILEKNNVVAAKYDEKIMLEAVKDADVVHFMVPVFIAHKATLLVESLGIPITAGFHAQAENLTSHLGMQNLSLVNHFVYKIYNHNLFCRANAIHYPTQFIRDLFEKEIKQKTNGYVISNGVNNRFKPMVVEKPEHLKDKFCILFIGRFSKEKSHKILMKAVEKSKYKDKIQLIFAGDGELKEKVIKYGNKHLPNPPIIGFYSRDELVRVINYCDLYCHPAEVEIEAIACLEAITCGLVPVIANSKKCATKAFAIDQRSLFKVNDSKDLASKIDYFIDNPQEKKLLREKYLSNSKTYDQDYCMQQMEQMLIDVVTQHKNQKKQDK